MLPTSPPSVEITLVIRSVAVETTFSSASAGRMSMTSYSLNQSPPLVWTAPLTRGSSRDLRVAQQCTRTARTLAPRSDTAQAHATRCRNILHATFPLDRGAGGGCRDGRARSRRLRRPAPAVPPRRRGSPTSATATSGPCSPRGPTRCRSPRARREIPILPGNRAPGASLSLGRRRPVPRSGSSTRQAARPSAC